MASPLPSLPVVHREFLNYVQSQPNTPMEDLVKPYMEFDAVMRKKFAQEPLSPMIQDNFVNIVPVYDEAGCNELRIRARDLESETQEQKEKYVLPLSEKDRKPNGSPAIVSTLKEFRNNFALFTEGCLSDIDWSNVVAAGSAVVTSLLPVPEEYRHSKRGLRQYYHEKFAPASDVDLFLYGLNEEQAIEKIKHIEDKIKNTILYETTTVRTKNTITIASQYPNRHVQIVLRIYRSVAEILTGFDVDVSCAAFDGGQVYASPRAIAAYATQTNQIDLTRRSPSYENRLSKYSHRGFEVFWSGLDRSRIDPTIFERSFNRTVGLARLLVLEKLPKSDDREEYLQKRREERGRPALSMWIRNRHGKELRGNIKDDWEDEVPEWQEQDQVSDYHTFTIPYGRNFNAKKIEKMLYTKDLLLNAQWNQGKDREVYLHRHPAFFGEAEHVIHDCCGSCPPPVTEAEKKIAEEEAKIYVSGDITFIKDDPGRQEIGSFNPITETDWTEMAYVGRTERLCKAIVADDLEAVESCLAEEGSNPDRRDYTGRTPLQLACMSSTPEIVQVLVNHGARMIPRMADGKTALHLAASRGNAEIVRILLTKSNENEEEEARKQESLKDTEKEADATTAEEDQIMEDAGDQDDDMSNTSASYVKVEQEPLVTNDTLEENDLEPDVYDVNVVAWDSRASPLHLAVLNGHSNVIQELVSSFGADVLMPVKILNEYNRKPEGAILNLVLSFSLPLEQGEEISRALLKLGASPAQADLRQKTAFYYSVECKREDMLKIYYEHDQPAVKRAINHFASSGNAWMPIFSTALTSALQNKNASLAIDLMNMGAKPEFEIGDLVRAHKLANPKEVYFGGIEERVTTFWQQPILLAVSNDMPLLAVELLARGVNPNTVMTGHNGTSVLTSTRDVLTRLREFLAERPVWWPSFNQAQPFFFQGDDESYLSNFPPDSYQRLVGKIALQKARKTSEDAEKQIKKEQDEFNNVAGLDEKRSAIASLISDYEKLEAELLARGAMTWSQLQPEQPYGHGQHPIPQPSNMFYPETVARTFKLEFKFETPGLSDVRRNGYLQLFEAAWNGDLPVIEALTLSMWGPAGDQPPLEIAVTDSHSMSCLSISIMRRHLDVAGSVLQILRQQYKPKESQAQKRFEMGSDDGSDDGSDEGGLNIVGETVDDTFTHDNVGEVTTQVESNISPLKALESSFDAFVFLGQSSSEEDPKKLWTSDGSVVIDSFVKYAIYTNDPNLLDWILETGKQVASEDPSDETHYQVMEDELQVAILVGRTDFLSKLIQYSAVGLPLAKLSAESGVKPPQEHQYYQGLSIRGSKRSDWANAGREESTDYSSPPTPLLISAFMGNVASTEFFLGTAPGRYYLDYVNSHPERTEIKTISQSKLGLEGSVLNWLQTRNNLVLHCAVMSKPCEESERLVQYLIDHHPECLEAQCESGKTPLALAFSLHRLEFARMLIAAGANQAARDSQANNLLHMALFAQNVKVCGDSEKFNELVGLLDNTLIPTMLVQRAGENARTPLTHWLNYLGAIQIPESKSRHEVVTSMTNAILALAAPTDQKHLEIFDGAGNTPAHFTVKQNLPEVLTLLLDRRPDLLYRENSTGTTPLEMAVTAWVNKATARAPNDSQAPKHLDEVDLVKRDPKFFVEGYQRPEQEPSDDVIMLRICQERARQHPGKRRLVSLFEANEVAKRLATTQRASDNNRGRYFRRRRGDGTSECDEVEQWISMASQW